MADKPLCHTISIPVLENGGQEEFAFFAREYYEGRGVNDFGRLLVCLSYRHKDGSITLLRREHEDDTEKMELDWAEKSGPCNIQGLPFSVRPRFRKTTRFRLIASFY